MRRLVVLLFAITGLFVTQAQAHYLHIDRAQRAAVHGANFFRGSDKDRVVVSGCRHGHPASKLVYCHVTETGPAIEALDWDTMDYVIAVALSRHRSRLVVNGGYSVNWYEPLFTSHRRHRR